MVTKPGLMPRKVMLYVWNWKGIVRYDLLQPDQTINSNLYCQQMERLRQAIEKMRPELINGKGFYHNNATPHTSLATHQKLREFDWEILMHPP